MNQNNIKIIRSSKRKKTIQAKMVKDEIWIYMPDSLTRSEEKKWIKHMTKRFEKKKRLKKLNTNDSLYNRAQQLNKKYFDGNLDFEIKYVSNQRKRVGSCSPYQKRIRLSDRVVDMPQWVQDYVIIHELAHLIHANHSKRFWEKVYQYKYTERAKGYLIAIGMHSQDDEELNTY